MPQHDSEPNPSSSSPSPEATRSANQQWLESVVRPAFELFAVGGEVRARGPVVFTRAKEWCVEIPSPKGAGRGFSACIGLRELERDGLAVEITGDADPFPGARTRELDMTSVLGALIMAFRRWQHVHG